MKRVIGILLISAVGFVFFIPHVVMYGFLTALGIWVTACVIAAVIVYGCHLIANGD